MKKSISIVGLFIVFLLIIFTLLIPVHKDISWSARIKTVGGASAYKEFVNSVVGFPVEEQHAKAHEFGQLLYEAEGSKGITVCDAQFDYGCFHQLVADEIVNHGTDSIYSINLYCLTLPSPNQCQHGLGHGILAYVGYRIQDLEIGLPICAELQKDRGFGCYIGLFMEYNYRTMLGSNAPIRSNTDGLFSPCDKISATYAYQCYFSEPHWWRHAFFYNLDADTAFVKMGTICRGIVDTKSRLGCFSGLGWEAYPSGGFTKKNAEHLCEIATRSTDEKTICNDEATIVSGEPAVL